MAYLVRQEEGRPARMYVLAAIPDGISLHGRFAPLKPPRLRIEPLNAARNSFFARGWYGIGTTRGDAVMALLQARDGV